MLEEIDRTHSRAAVETPKRIRNRVAEIDAKILAIVEAIDPAHADAANTAISKLKAQRAELAARLREADDREETSDRIEAVGEITARVIMHFAGLWSGATPAQRRAILKCFVSRIEVNPADSTVTLHLWRVPKTNLAPTKLFASSEPGIGGTGSGGGI